MAGCVGQNPNHSIARGMALSAESAKTLGTRCSAHPLLPLIGGSDLAEHDGSPHRRQWWRHEDLRVEVTVRRNAASSRSGLTLLPYSGLQGVAASRRARSVRGS